MEIHPNAIVSESAKIGKNVKIGPFCIIGKDVILEEDVELKSHVVLEGRTRIGKGTVIYPFASIGQIPQILKYDDDNAEVVIGKYNRIREYVTIQSGINEFGGITQIGDNNLLMVGVHIAHDCILGNNIVIANYASLAGHVEVGDYVVIGGLAAVHQFTRIGMHSMIGGLSGLARDLIPFGTAVSDRAYLEGVNLVGMKRHGFENSEALAAKKAVDALFSSEDVMSARILKIREEFGSNEIVKQVLDFITKDSNRSFCGPKKNK